MKQSFLAWERALSFLVEELGFDPSTRDLRSGGYALRYQRVDVGVEVSYEVRDVAMVRVCRLDAVHGWPRSPGEIGPSTPLHCAGLLDLETVARRPPNPVAWSIPTEHTIAASADSLRAERELLLGDFTALDQAADLLRSRARRAAEAKWGALGAARRWGHSD